MDASYRSGKEPAESSTHLLKLISPQYPTPPLFKTIYHPAHSISNPFTSSFHLLCGPFLPPLPSIIIARYTLSINISLPPSFSYGRTTSTLSSPLLTVYATRTHISLLLASFLLYQSFLCYIHLLNISPQTQSFLFSPVHSMTTFQSHTTAGRTTLSYNFLITSLNNDVHIS